MAYTRHCEEQRGDMQQANLQTESTFMTPFPANYKQFLLNRILAILTMAKSLIEQKIL